MDGNFPKKDRFPGTENTKDKKQNKPKLGIGDTV